MIHRYLLRDRGDLHTLPPHPCLPPIPLRTQQNRAIYLVEVSVFITHRALLGQFAFYVCMYPSPYLKELTIPPALILKFACTEGDRPRSSLHVDQNSGDCDLKFRQ